MTSSYSYPDTDDNQVNVWLSHTSPEYRRYFLASEGRVFARMRELIDARLGQLTGPARLLDAGCGDGRLLSELAAPFAEVLLVEPDRARLASAQKRAAELGYAAKTRAIATRLEELALEVEAQVVVCSHVVQHVACARLAPLLARLRAVTAPDGLLLLTAAHSVTGFDHFDRTCLVDGAIDGQVISQAEFDRLASNAMGTELPSRIFCRPSIEQAFEAAGFAPFEFRVFHLDEAPAQALAARVADIDAYANSSPRVQAELGVDLFVAARARSK